MRTELRILLAMFLILVVMVGTNLLFPMVTPDPVTPTDSIGAPQAASGADGTEAGAAVEATGEPADQTVEAVPTIPGAAPAQPGQAAPAPGVVQTGRELTVETPLYRVHLSTEGAAVRSFGLATFESFANDDESIEDRPPVELIQEGAPFLSNRIVLRSDTLDLRSVVFETDRSGDLVLNEGGGSETLNLLYQHPTQPFAFEVAYTFWPDSYVIQVEGQATGITDGVLLTDFGYGIPVNEVRAQDDRQVFGFVSNHSRSGIRAERLGNIEEAAIVEGPLHWVAFKSKYFVISAVAATDGSPEHVFGGAVIGEQTGEDLASAVFAQSFDGNGEFSYRLYAGPQDRARLVALEANLENVNPYGWAFLRPIIRPFTGIITAVLIWMHQNLNLAYGWVLMLFGVLMRVVLFPLYQKAMRAQLKNMAVQPKLKEIQTRYKDKPEQLQKEMMKLYKEDGFNPLGGCLPMLLPWPILVALFFVFQNTIELRGIPFLWMPDLSAPDPLYILPLFLGLSMFLLQFISVRSIPDANPQMKMMMWIFPVVFTVMFANFASGLNLYYATTNLAMLPQQIWIAQERKAASEKNAAKKAASEAGQEGDDGGGGDRGDVPVAEVVASAPTPGPEGAGQSRSAKKRKKRRGKN